MTDYGPGPCDTCHEDIEAHTTAELKRCLASEERCELTALSHEQFGHCRGSEEPSPTEGVLVERFAMARYPGRCALDTSHRIEPGDQIGLAVTEDEGKELGWACGGCLDTLTGVSRD